MKKIMAFLLAIVTIGTFAGCGTTEVDENPSGTVSQVVAGSVTTDGSTSMEKVIGFLSEAYMEENNKVKVTYNPTGSGSGIQAVLDGRCDIGLSSRNLKEAEAEELTGTVVAIDGIAVIVNHENSVSDLTVEQIGALYRGEIENWKELGGNDAPVVLIGREAASGTRDGFESITGTEDLCKYTQELTSTGDVVQTVASNPNAIGYASLASVKDNVKVLLVEGVKPTTESIQSGDYKIQRNFVFVTKKDGAVSSACEDFFNFATSGEADDYIIAAGAVPVAR